MKKLSLALLSLCYLSALSQVSEPEHHDVFVSGTDGYHTYRIPAVVVSKKGTVLAFAEGRVTKSDHAENDMVLRRSEDGGKSWSNLQVLVDDGENSLNNPQAVVLENGRILLMYQRYPQGFHEREVVPGYTDDRVCRNYVMYSDDDGVSWSTPRETTSEVKRPVYVTSIASGPGIGIQLTRGKYQGRIIMPFNQGPAGAWQVYAVFSDDMGETWNYGETAPEISEGQGNEVQMVELSDGSIMLNSRSNAGDRKRKVSISKDGGQHWSGLIDDQRLVESQCMGSILRYSFESEKDQSVILFANPATARGRHHGTVRMSFDEGETWPVSKLLVEGSFAYSCLAKLDNGNVGLLYETDNYGKISFAEFSIDWLRHRDYSPYYLHKKSQFELLPDDQDEIIFLGNSITDGGHWVEWFKDLNIKNRGIGGDVTYGILNRLDEVVASKPSKIFIMIGINDLSRGYSVHEILRNYESILKFISSKSPSSEVYIQSVLPVSDALGRFTNFKWWDSRVTQINEGLKKLAKEKNRAYVDLYSVFADQEGRLKAGFTEDGLHLTGKGYEAWKKRIERDIKK